MFTDSLRGKTIAVLGLAFKPNTDDMRETPSVPLIAALQDMGARVRAFDPASMDQAKAVLKNVTYGDSAYACADGADALVIATEWDEFRALDLERLRKLMKHPVIVDLRNIYAPEEISRFGFDYSCVGRPPGPRLRSSADRRRK
jgi:UDPglucose 6-dehydrogenase